MKDDKKKAVKEKQERTNVMLNPTRVEKLKALGGGNLSKGIRIACDAIK